MRVLDSDAESWDDEDIEGAGCDEAARILINSVQSQEDDETYTNLNSLLMNTQPPP
jgi:hypothetical protein